jgi:hypothetical protein
MIDSNALRLSALLMFSPPDLPMNEYDRWIAMLIVVCPPAQANESMDQRKRKKVKPIKPINPMKNGDTHWICPR